MVTRTNQFDGGGGAEEKMNERRGNEKERENLPVCLN